MVSRLEGLIATPDEIVIRHAIPSDEARVEQLVREMIPDDPHTYAANIRYPNECINVVAESSQAGIVGFTSLLIDATPQLGTQEWRKYPLYIGVIAVDRQYRRRHVGTQMLNSLARTAQGRAPQHIWLHLHVHQDNESAVKCFESFGFERAGEFRPDKDGKWSWLMRRNIREYPR